MAALGSKAVGSTIKLNVNGVARNFIIVHQGKPSASYDSSCDGTWLLMEDIYESRQWHSSSSNDYENSDIHNYLSNTFINLFDNNIKSAIKQIKIPYTKGKGNEGTYLTGSDGLSTKVFLLSNYEVTNDLNYFKAGNSKYGYLNGESIRWWLRSVSANNGYLAGFVGSASDPSYIVTSTQSCKTTAGVRPALVLPSTFSVNTAPTISGSDGSLGTFSTNIPTACYTINDENGDSVTATVKLNGATKETQTVALGTAYTYTPSTADWAALALGTHTITITANDGQESVTRTYTFVKEKPVLGTVTVGGIAKEYKDVYVNVGGAWKEAEKVYVMVNGVWKSV